MLHYYSLHDARHQVFEPMRLWAGLMRSTFENPFNPVSYTAWGRGLAASADILEGLLRKRPKPAWGFSAHETIHGSPKTNEEIAIEPVLTRPFGDLVKMTLTGGKKDRPRLLLVAPMSGHHATLLRGTIQTLVPYFDLYVTDWRDAAQVPPSAGNFSIENYIAEMIMFMRFLGEDHHVMAVCQPAPMVLAAVSILADLDDAAQPQSMILMGGPVDASASETLVTKMAETHSLSWFRNNLISQVPWRYPGKGRMVYPGFLQLRAFLSMNPSRHMAAHWNFFQHLVQGDGESADSHRRFYDEYLAVMDVDAQFFLDTVQMVFKEHHLARGIMRWQNRLVDPSLIQKTALFTIEGALDDISAPGQTYAAHALCAGLAADKKQHLLQQNVGHYGIFNGAKFRQHIAPKIRDFIFKYSKSPAAKPSDIRANHLAAKASVVAKTGQKARSVKEAQIGASSPQQKRSAKVPMP